jgi:Ser/Thr protein kinase RdoA (MazF antagonist)
MEDSVGMAASSADVRAVAAAFGLGDTEADPVVQARGRQGRVWRVRTGRGCFAVKELFVELTEQQAQVEAEFQAVIADRGVRAPRPVRTVTGAVLERVAGIQFRVHSWVAVLGPRRDLDPETVGTLMAALHRDPLPASPTGTEPWHTVPVPDQEWEVASERLARAGAPFAKQFALARVHFRTLRQVFRPPDRTQLCHRDLWADNLRLTQDGGLCVLDWDNCGPADPAQELAVPLVEFCYDDADRAAALYRAYRRAGGPGRLSDRGDFTMVLAQFDHFAVTAARQWLAAGDDAARARAQAWFDEGWAEPLGLPEIDRLLCAVRGS